MKNDDKKQNKILFNKLNTNDVEILNTDYMMMVQGGGKKSTPIPGTEFHTDDNCFQDWTTKITFLGITIKTKTERGGCSHMGKGCKNYCDKCPHKDSPYA